MVLKLPRLRRGSELVTLGRAASDAFALVWDQAMKALESNFNGLQEAVAAIQAAQAAADAADAKAETAIADAAAAQAAADAAATLAAQNRNPLALVATPDFFGGTRVGSGTVTTNAVEVMPLNGTAPFTYVWAKLTGDSLFIDIDSPTAATTTITASHNSAPQTREGLVKCTVTDSSTPARSGVLAVQYETTST